MYSNLTYPPWYSDTGRYGVYKVYLCHGGGGGDWGYTPTPTPTTARTRKY